MGAARSTWWLRRASLAILIIGVLYLGMVVLPVYLAGIAQYTQSDIVGLNAPIPARLRLWTYSFGTIIVVLTVLGHDVIPYGAGALLGAIGLFGHPMPRRTRGMWMIALFLLVISIVLTWDAGNRLLDIIVD